jgi:hypothetical protein
MKPICKIFTACIVFLVIGTYAAKAHDEYTRVLKKEFTINPDAKLIIDNKFGKVHCNNWEKNVISMEIVTTVVAADEKSAAKMFDRISIVTTATPAQVEALTVFQGDNTQGKSKMTIDYTINMPASISLDLTNKFGDIYINELNGKAKIDLSYGNMEINKLNNSDNLLDIKFSKVNIKSIKGAVLSLKYSDLDLEYAGSLRIDAKYSTMYASQVISLAGSYEGGKLNMENSSAIDGKTRFSDLSITRLEKNLNLEIQYGSFDVDEMPADFGNISIQNKYGNVSIGLPKDASYSLDANMKYCDLDFPDDRADFSQKITTNTGKIYKAIVGKTVNPAGKVFVRSEFGNVSIE